MQKIFQSSWFKYAMVVLAFAGGFIVKTLFFETTSTAVIANLRQQNTNYQYVDPLLLCRITGLPLEAAYENLKNQITEHIDSVSGKVQKASVVFRDMKSGETFGINQNDQYIPASLLKLPLMIAYLKAYEDDPAVFEKKLTLAADADPPALQTYKPQQSVKPGEAYTVEQLLYYMIVYSDNIASGMLDSYMEPATKNSVYSDLGLEIPPDSLTVDFMSARLYSYFFRILYNATYLSPEVSEDALQLLVKAHFPDGIEAGVPKDIPIAQKFGERTVTANGDLNNPLYNELHSCGIVFYPEHPYLLCVMTKGESFADLSTLIQTISKTVYEAVDKKHQA